MVATDNFQKIEVSSRQELREWLYQNHLQVHSVWLATYKKSIPEKYLSTADVLDELLCFGWIDGIRRKLDSNRTMQLVSPRKAQHLAGTYKSRAAKLIAEGKMQEGGFRSIAKSKEEGLWDFMDDVDKLIIPADLKEVLSRYEGATEFFLSINPSSKRFVLGWIKLAKTAKVRENRLIKIATLASKGEKLEGS